MSQTSRIVIVIALVAVVAVVVVTKSRNQPPRSAQTSNATASASTAALSRLVDLGAGKCIPCKMMAPILEELKKELAGKLQVDFIDVWENPDAGKSYDIRIIPTQIFFNAAGKELFRHEGFFAKADILAKWKELGVELGDQSRSLTRWTPIAPDKRPADQACYMCDGNIDPKARTTFKSPKGDVALCSPHCFFIVYTSLLDTNGADEKVAVTDWGSGKIVPALQAAFLYGVDDHGKATIKAFTSKEDAIKERQNSGGNVLEWAMLREKELATRCGFCDRAVYPEDACTVKAGTASLLGCCPGCPWSAILTERSRRLPSGRRVL